MEKRASFVELNRRFRKLEPSARAEETALESYIANALSSHRGTLSWDELLNEKRVVILGEPGSGKSWEFQERARILVNQGEFAFFVRLDHLIDQDLQKVLSETDRTRFNLWRRGGQAAYFFLDSVDEAKLRKISDFHAALKKFSYEIGTSFLQWTRVFLSSRISEWKPLVDGFEFRNSLPLAPFDRHEDQGRSSQIEKPNPEFLVVQIEPLDQEQVELFSKANGVSDVPSFVEALDSAFAWEFARRPLDVSDLIGFWNNNRRIGSLTHMIESDIRSKLRPREGRDELPLSDAGGHEGVEWLAAASLFSRRFSFCVPDDSVSSPESLNARDCVPGNWTADQVRALLNRAIFDSGVYGHFRFHHRRVAEYLAGKWLAVRMRNGCHQIELENVLTETVRGRKILRPSMHSIAAWLCSGGEGWNLFARRLVIETDPGIHLQHGDPASLPVEYRREVLMALSCISRTRKRM